MFSMTRSIALLISVVLASLALATQASALSIAFPAIVGASGDYVFTQSGADRVTRKNMRTGKLSSFQLPISDYVNDGDADSRLNPHAIATVTGWGDDSLKLSIAGIGIKPRVLATLDRTGKCSKFDEIRPLQIDTKDVVTVRFVEGTPSGDDCVRSARIARYTKTGVATDVAIPDAIRQKLLGAGDVAVRGNRLMLANRLEPSSSVTVFDLATGVTVWEGSRPAAFDWSMPEPGVLWSRLDYLGHESRAYRFNYETGKSVTIKIPHPRAGKSCGRFTIHAGGPRLKIYDEKGHLARSVKLRGDKDLNGTVYCSNRIAYIPMTSKKRVTRMIVDLTKLR